MTRKCRLALALSVLALPSLGAPPAAATRISDLAFLAGSWATDGGPMRIDGADGGLTARVEGDTTSPEKTEEIRYRSTMAGCR